MLKVLQGSEGPNLSNPNQTKPNPPLAGHWGAVLEPNPPLAGHWGAVLEPMSYS